MRTISLGIFGLVLFVLSQNVFAQENQTNFATLAQEPCEGFCQVADTGLPLRIIARVASNVRAEPDAGSGIVVSNVDAFQPFFVSERQIIDETAGNAWYQITDAPRGQPIGWMNAEDVIEWRQALVVAFTPPGTGANRRSRVVMFDSAESLERTLESSDRVTNYAGIVEDTLAGNAPDGVISIEPGGFLNVDDPQVFYIIPVTDFRETRLDGQPGRMLAVELATSERAPEPGGTTVQDTDYLDDASSSESSIDVEGIDVVFVVDMTGSMQPVVDATRTAMQGAADYLSRFNQQARFGLIGYRDNADMVPGLEFVARNFTPELLDVAGFESLLGTVRAASVGSADYPEEVYAGLDLLTSGDIGWRDSSARLALLIGDASAHEPGHPQYTLGSKRAEDIRSFLRSDNVMIAALHLVSPEAPPGDTATAERQFRYLTQTGGPEGGGGASLYASADFSDQFGSVNEVGIGNGLQQLVQNMYDRAFSTSGASSGAAYPTTASSPNHSISGDTSSLAALGDLIGRTLAMQYSGRSQTIPRDFRAWVSDLDPTDPFVDSLSVRVMLTSEEVDSLVISLDSIMGAFVAQETLYEDFVDALQGTVAGIEVGRQVDVQAAGRLRNSQLFADWMTALPYHSAVLDLTPEDIGALQGSERDAFIASIQGRIELYRTLLADDGVWTSLNEGDRFEDRVVLLPLSDLP